MPTVFDLLKAVDNGSLHDIQTLLSTRNEQGIPSININQIPGFKTVLHYICFRAYFPFPRALSQQEIRSMFEYFVYLRDSLGNPIVDPNIMHDAAGNAVTAIVETQDSYLLQLLLDLRTNQGEMVVDIYGGLHPGHFWSPLRRAIFKNNLNMVMALVDARNARGIPLITHDQINCDLIGATSNRYGVGAFIGGNASVDFLRRHLQLTQPTQPTQPNRPNRPTRPTRPIRPTQPIPPTQPNQALEVIRFNGDPQSTHDPSVTRTATASLLSLNNRYEERLASSDCLREISDFIEAYNYDLLMSEFSFKEKKEWAKECLKLLIERLENIHSYTNYTIKKIASLVWMAVCDNNIQVFPEEMRRTFPQEAVQAPFEIVDLKKSSFIEKLIQASREYKERGYSHAICIGGLIHKLLEVLNCAHIDVVITTGLQAIQPAANEMALAIVGRTLESEKDSLRNYLLSHWDDALENETVAKFQTTIATCVRTGLSQYFETLLDLTKIEEIVSSLPDMPRPSLPHKKLNALVTRIVNSHEFKALHKFARDVYLREDLVDYEAKYQALNAEFEAFEEINKIIKSIKQENESNQLETQGGLQRTLEKIKAIFANQEKSNLEKKHEILKMYDCIKFFKIANYLRNYIDRAKLLTFNQPSHQLNINDFLESIDTALNKYEGTLNAHVDGMEHDQQTLMGAHQELSSIVEQSVGKIKDQLEKEPGIWRNLSPIIKGILGVLAILLVIPGLVVLGVSKHGLTGTFFSKPRTEDSEKLKPDDLIENMASPK